MRKNVNNDVSKDSAPSVDAVFFFSRFLRQTHFAAGFQQFVSVNHTGIQHLFHHNQQGKLPSQQSECYCLFDQHPVSPYKFNTLSSKQMMRIKKLINKLGMF